MKFVNVAGYVNTFLILHKERQILCFLLPVKFVNRLITSIYSDQIFHPHYQLGEQKAYYDCVLRLFACEFTACYLASYRRLDYPDISISSVSKTS
jgi:hypothetical protein